jgi:hypothetical protein
MSDSGGGNDQQPAPAGSNWLSDWAAATPVVTRYSIYIVLATTIVAWVTSVRDMTGCGGVWEWLGVTSLLLVLLRQAPAC